MSELARYIKIMANKKEEVYSVFAKVLSVDKENNTCVVRPIRNADSDIEYIVQLGSKFDDENDFIIYPMVDSTVLITWISKQDAFISLHGDIDEIYINPTNKIRISNDEEDFKTIVNDLVGAIKDLTVNTAWGVSSTPVNSSDFEDINKRINKLFTDGSE